MQRPIICLSLALLLSMPLGIREAAGAAEPAVELLAPAASATKVPATPEHPAIVRTRPVRLNTKALDALERGEPIDLAVQLFEGVSVRPVFKRFERPQLGGYVWTGELADDPYGHFVLSVCEGAVVAEFRSASWPIHQIRYAGDEVHMVREVDRSQGQARSDIPPATSLPPSAPPHPEPAPTQPDLSTAAGADSSGSGVFIDVLVVYTPAARDAKGGTSGIHATINYVISDANICFSNSGIAHRLRLVGWEQVDYTESGSFHTDLEWLAGAQEVQQWRNRDGADLVNMLATGSLFDTWGVGYTPAKPPHTGLVSSMAYSVVSVGSPELGITFAHELSHNFGCNHTPGDHGATDPSEALAPYAFGHRLYAFPFWYRTVMAYPSILEPALFPIWYFSNPDTRHYYGVPMGIAGQRNNARMIRESGPTVAGYKSTVLPDGTWVDVEYTGAERGTWLEPYNTVAEGFSHVPTRGTLIFKPGSQNWTGTITKLMTMRAHDGNMLIGQ